MTFKSIAEFLDPKNGHTPTSAERKLIAKTRAGEPCFLTDAANPTCPVAATDPTSIRASLLRLMILGGSETCGLHQSGVWLWGGWIAGKLDLSYCTTKGATTLSHCHFADRPDFGQTTFRKLILSGSSIPGLFAQGAVVAGDLFLRQVTATGTVDAGGAKIGGQLDCTGAKLDGKDAKGNTLKALNVQGAEVGQDLFLYEVTAKGTVSVSGAKVGGQMSCTGATLDGGKDAKGNTQKALNVQGAEVGQNRFLSQVTATGTVSVSGAKIGGQLSCTGATLDGGKDGEGTALQALNAQGVEVGHDLLLRQVTAMGAVDVNSAKIGGQLDCIGAIFDGGKDAQGTALQALNAEGLRVSQSFLFRKSVKVQGQVNLTAAHFGDLVDDPDCWPAVPDSLILDGLTYDRIDGPTTFAAREKWLTAGSHWFGEFFPQPYTQLARVLRQMGHAGEARQVLMEREKLLAKHRLASDRKDFRAAYDGGVMTKGDSGWIWLRMTLARLWYGLTRRVAGYGYAPQRALYCALVCIGISFFAYMLFWQLGAMVPTDAVILTSEEWKAAFDLDAFRPALIWTDPERSGPATSHYETFYSLPYALDVFLPIVDLGQQSTWGQTTVTWAGWAARLWTWGLQIAGYVITSLGLAAATGIIQRNQPD